MTRRLSRRGAGGTSGGVGSFFMGFIMMCTGFYLLLNSISVTSSFGSGARLFHLSNFGMNYDVTGGMVMIPFIFGIGMVFYNGKSILGWMLTVGSVSSLIFGVISSIRFRFVSMSAFDLMVILVLAIGGMGILFRSLKQFE